MAAAVMADAETAVKAVPLLVKEAVAALAYISGCCCKHSIIAAVHASAAVVTDILSVVIATLVAVVVVAGVATVPAGR